MTDNPRTYKTKQQSQPRLNKITLRVTFVCSPHRMKCLVASHLIPIQLSPHRQPPDPDPLVHRQPLPDQLPLCSPVPILLLPATLAFAFVWLVTGLCSPHFAHATANGSPVEPAEGGKYSISVLQAAQVSEVQFSLIREEMIRGGTEVVIGGTGGWSWGVADELE